LCVCQRDKQEVVCQFRQNFWSDGRCASQQLTIDIGGDARHDTPAGSSKQLFAIAGWGQATIRMLRSTPQMMTTMLIGL